MYIKQIKNNEKNYNLFYSLRGLTILDEELIAEAAVKCWNFEQAKEVLDLIESEDFSNVEEALDYVTRYD